ncbi:hypothetical protein A2U01_0064175, partial [Trifolium medium]|nr:hypothetical protein [Trifolium medium]
HDKNFQPPNPPQSQGYAQAPPPGYFQEAYGPYSGQNFPPGFGKNYGFGFPNFNMWPVPTLQLKPTVPFGAPSAMMANTSAF